MPPFRCRRRRSYRAALAAAALLLSPVAVFAEQGSGAPGKAPSAIGPARAFDVGGELARARTAQDEAEAALAAAKRVATPGHLLDPLPERLMAGIGALQAQYAEMERKAAGYRATLGDQHPTLKGADEVLAELRGQILEGARRAAAAAQEDVVRTRETVASLERQARAAEATASIAPPAEVAAPPRSAGPPRAAPPAAAEAPAHAPREGSAASAGEGTSTASVVSRMAAGALPLALRHPLAAAGLAAVVGLAALTLLVARRRARGRRSGAKAQPRIEPSALPTRSGVAARPEPRPAPAAVPVLAALSLGVEREPLAGASARDPDGAFARGAASILATLAAAAGGPGSRVGVVVTAAAGAPAAWVDALAMGLAEAAAEAGRRPLLIDGRADGRLGRALAAETAAAATVAVGGRTRTVLRATAGERTVAVLGDDAEETTSAGPLPRVANLDGFDAIVIAGEPGAPETAAVPFALLVAPRGAAAPDIAAAARIAAGATGRPCGAVLVAPLGDEEIARPPARPDAPFARRRGASDAPPSRLGLRRTLDPGRRRA